ncbi:hypothetical protein FSP39_011885 [Pinctada imbricata]|uniref:Uncharacterized protein n=1 Tax=Pinctada imbricata TaxID=66713 RepID=A0AA89BLX4_PINIB|nr:hypothetical protein FSP39_011885 [Pinctada imbricata]
MDMVEILRMFIYSERTGNWELHKGCISATLPFLAASGHNLYVKSAAIYLQKMQELPNSNPSVERFFQEGHHVLRRSQKFWAGLSPDLVIEQVLMRSIKTTGGLTRGRGMTDVQRAQGVLSMPHCARINEAMQEVTSVNFHTSDQHKELGDTRKKRDDSDTHAMIEFLNQRSPFAQVKELRNIETGVSGDERVNADKAFDVGKDILQSMEGNKVSEYVFKKSRQVITLSSKSSVKLDDDELKVDPQLLFQRLLAATGGHYPDLTEVCKFELSSIPTSMFDTSGVMRLADKSSLADYLWKQLSPSEISDDSTARSVVDGGSLLHKIPWNRGDTFLSICRMYVDFVVRRYPCPTVVFDGYEAGPSTKDNTHRRRTHGITGTRVIFEESTPFRSKKDIFLSNNQNKQDFIKMLSSELRKEGIDVKQAEADADVLISKTAIELSRSQSTTLFGEDTDLLVLLLFHADENCQLHLRSDKLNNNQKVWNIAEAKRSLGPNLCNLLPVIHALTGCDTTSRLYSIGKGLAIKRFCLQKLYATLQMFSFNAVSRKKKLSKLEKI